MPDPRLNTPTDCLTQNIKSTKKRLANYLENSFNGILNIFHRTGLRAPDPDTGSTPLLNIQASCKMAFYVADALPI